MNGLESMTKKVGIVSCSGEDLPGGTVSRLASRKVLDELKPGESVTICLPLFVAGGEEERSFAQKFPTITVDGCEKRCAQKSTEALSGKPGKSILIPEILNKAGFGRTHPEKESRTGRAGGRPGSGRRNRPGRR